MTWTASQRKYAQSEKGRLSRKKYQESSKAKETRKRYQEGLKLKKQQAKDEINKQKTTQPKKAEK